MDIEGENLEKTKEIETMQSISSYINPNTRGLTSNASITESILLTIPFLMSRAGQRERKHQS